MLSFWVKERERIHFLYCNGDEIEGKSMYDSVILVSHKHPCVSLLVVATYIMQLYFTTSLSTLALALPLFFF